MAKNLKKLSFAKEELVNLNEYEMSHIKGGEAGTTTIVRISLKATKKLTETYSVYTATRELTLWGNNDRHGGDNDRPQDFQIEEPGSTYVLEDGSCLLNTLIVTAEKK